MDRRGLSLQERNLESQVRFRMNEHGKVQVDQLEIVGARTKKKLVKDSGLLKCNTLELQGGETFQESMPKL